MSLEGRVALITGAGGGIGREIALSLAREKVKIVLFGGKTLEKLKETQRLVNKVGGESMIVAGNLTDDKFLKDGFNEVLSKTNGIDILINNAGKALNCPIELTQTEILDEIMNINFRAPYILTQLALPTLLKSSRASIINIASVVAHVGYPGQSAYTASKHALLGFTKSLAQEVFDKGVRVHAISPGGVYTDMIKISRPDLTDEGMIKPKDIADIVLFLLKNRGNAVIDEILVHRVNKTPFYSGV